MRERTRGILLAGLVLAGVGAALAVHEVREGCDEWGRFLYERDVNERYTRLVMLEGGKETALGDEKRLHAATFSPRGDAVVVTAGREGSFDGDFGYVDERTILYTMDLDGGDLEILTENAADPRWSPDGRHVLFVRYEGRNRGLWVIDLYTKEERLVFATPPSQGPDPNHIGDATWSSDSKRIAVAIWFTGRGRAEHYRLYTIASDGSDRREILKTPAAIGDLAWSPDGETFMWSGPLQGSAVSTGSINVASVSNPRPKSIEPHSSNPMFSADGKRIAYVIGWEGHYPSRLVIGPLDGSNPQRVPGTPEEESGSIPVHDWVNC